MMQLVNTSDAAIICSAKTCSAQMAGTIYEAHVSDNSSLRMALFRVQEVDCTCTVLQIGSGGSSGSIRSGGS